MAKYYDAEFKRSAVELALASEKTMAEIERDLGINRGTLKHWVKKAQADGAEAFPGKGNVKASEQELRRLQRENAVLRQERDILKKAIAIFSQAAKSEGGS